MSLAHACHLTPAEQELVAAFPAGLALDLGDPLPPDAPGPDPARLVHGPLIRELVLSEDVPAPRCRRLTIVGADIDGPVDLGFARSDCPLRLERCRFFGPVDLTEAELRSVSLAGSTCRGLDARHVRVTGDLCLDGLRSAGAVVLAGAHLADDLHLERATIEGPTPVEPTLTVPPAEAPLLDLAHIEVEGSMHADSLTVAGLLCTYGASINGSGNLRDAHLGRVGAAAEGNPGVAWNGDGMRVAGQLDATGLWATGQVRLVDAQLLSLVLSGVQVESRKYGVVLDRLQTRGSVFCDEDSRLIGGIHAMGLQVGATLYLGRGLVEAPEGEAGEEPIAIDLQRSRVGDDVVCSRGFRCIGAFALADSHIGGLLSLDGATLEPAPGRQIAFSGTRMTLGGALSCTQGFFWQGVMRMVGGSIGGVLRLDTHDAVPKPAPAASEPILVAQGAHISRSASIRTTGTVNLSGAQIGGELELYASQLRAEEDNAAADLSAVAADVLTLHGRPEEGLLDLSRATVRLLRDHQADWPRPDIVLDGLQYQDVADLDQEPGEGASTRLGWLDAATRWTRRSSGYVPVEFASQPYRQLASVYQQTGRDGDARTVLHRMYVRQNAAMNRRHPLIRAWNSAQNICLGYGYRPWRAFAWIIALATVTSVWFSRQAWTDSEPVRAVLVSLGLALPGAGFDKLESFGPTKNVNVSVSVTDHVIAAVLVTVGLLLGATVIAAVARAFRR